ncbi:MAG: hypothetical protein K0R72_569 [Clostridia bacterium]|jgi:hypothetical protein|nr:hypothetical protein [Clostridia bacterium]
MDNKDNGHYIFVKSYRNSKTGKLMIAKDYGKKAWKIWIRDNNED